eukprot:scaffold7471_cov430-Prasinococcus_capsulatus_cf.AAC.2
MKQLLAATNAIDSLVAKQMLQHQSSRRPALRHVVSHKSASQNAGPVQDRGAGQEPIPGYSRFHPGF